VLFEYYSYRTEQGIYFKCIISYSCPCPSKLYIVKGVLNPGHADLTQGKSRYECSMPGSSNLLVVERGWFLMLDKRRAFCKICRGTLTGEAAV
jgi:hypothetical protein